MTFGQFSVSVFTMAGLAVTSNQLLQDGGAQRNGVSIGIDSLINRDIAKRLATLEEIALIDGSGTGQPLGILGTPGIGTVSLTPTDIPALLDATADAILDVQVDGLAEPSGILMHRRTWSRIIKAREGVEPDVYIIGAGANAVGRRGSDPMPQRELFGVPVYFTANMPINKGAGTNESRVIVGDFREALLDRQGVTVDTAEHVFFTSNKTVFQRRGTHGLHSSQGPSGLQRRARSGARQWLSASTGMQTGTSSK
jgi:HK97 family phage major capsid protein